MNEPTGFPQRDLIWLLLVFFLILLAICVSGLISFVFLKWMYKSSTRQKCAVLEEDVKLEAQSRSQAELYMLIAALLQRLANIALNRPTSSTPPVSAYRNPDQIHVVPSHHTLPTLKKKVAEMDPSSTLKGHTCPPLIQHITNYVVGKDFKMDNLGLDGKRLNITDDYSTFAPPPRQLRSPLDPPKTTSLTSVTSHGLISQTSVTPFSEYTKEDDDDEHELVYTSDNTKLTNSSDEEAGYLSSEARVSPNSAKELKKRSPEVDLTQDNEEVEELPIFQPENKVAQLEKSKSEGNAKRQEKMEKEEKKSRKNNKKTIIAPPQSESTEQDPDLVYIPLKTNTVAGYIHNLAAPGYIKEYPKHPHAAVVIKNRDDDKDAIPKPKRLLHKDESTDDSIKEYEDVPEWTKEDEEGYTTASTTISPMSVTKNLAKSNRRDRAGLSPFSYPSRPSNFLIPADNDSDSSFVNSESLKNYQDVTEPHFLELVDPFYRNPEKPNLHTLTEGSLVTTFGPKFPSTSLCRPESSLAALKLGFGISAPTVFSSGKRGSGSGDMHSTSCPSTRRTWPKDKLEYPVRHQARVYNLRPNL